jgi:hypothetical protein
VLAPEGTECGRSKGKRRWYPRAVQIFPLVTHEDEKGENDENTGAFDF